MTFATTAQIAPQRLSRHERIGQQLVLLDQRGEIAISFATCIEQNLGLNLRKAQLKRDVSGIVRKIADFRWETSTLMVLAMSIRHPAMTSLLDQLTERLTVVAERPSPQRSSWSPCPSPIGNGYGGPRIIALKEAVT